MEREKKQAMQQLRRVHDEAKRIGEILKASTKKVYEMREEVQKKQLEAQSMRTTLDRMEEARRREKIDLGKKLENLTEEFKRYKNEALEARRQIQILRKPDLTEGFIDVATTSNIGSNLRFI